MHRVSVESFEQIPRCVESRCSVGMSVEGKREGRRGGVYGSLRLRVSQQMLSID